MRSSKPPALLTPFPLTCCAAGLLASTACATRPGPTAPPPPLQAQVAASLREPCPRPDRPAAPGVGELAAFSVRQESALSVCEARKDAAVAVIDAFDAAANRLAAALAPKKPWWSRW